MGELVELPGGLVDLAALEAPEDTSAAEFIEGVVRREIARRRIRRTVYGDDIRQYAKPLSEYYGGSAEAWIEHRTQTE